MLRKGMIFMAIVFSAVLFAGCGDRDKEEVEIVHNSWLLFYLIPDGFGQYVNVKIIN